MKSPQSCADKKQITSFRIVSLTLAFAPFLLAAANTSAYAQTSDDPSSTASSSPADWTQLHRDNMQRWNPYETVLDVNNVGSLHIMWKNPNGTYVLQQQSAPAVVNGVIYFGSDDGNVY